MTVNFHSFAKLIIIISLSLAGCQGSATPDQRAATVQPAQVEPNSALTVEVANPISTPTIRATSTPSPSPTSTYTPQPSPTSTPQVISTESLSRLIITHRFSHPMGVVAVAFSPDSSLLASSAQDGLVRLWRIQDENLLFTLEGHGQNVRSLAFSPDGKLLATASDDQTVKLWQVEDGSLFKTIDTSMVGKALKVRFSNDNSLVFIAGDLCFIMLRNVNTGLTRRILKQPRCLVETGGFVQYWGLEIFPTGTSLVSGDGQPGGSGGSIQVWDYEEYTAPQLIKGYNLVIRDLSLSADGANLAVAMAASSDIWLFPVLDSSSITKLIGHTLRVNSIHFSPDGTLLVSGGRDTTVRLWDTATGALLSTMNDHTKPVNSVAFSPDGSLIASGSDDGKILIRELAPP
jgi:WD40 repeat protein